MFIFKYGGGYVMLCYPPPRAVQGLMNTLKSQDSLHENLLPSIWQWVADTFNRRMSTTAGFTLATTVPMEANVTNVLLHIHKKNQKVYLLPLPSSLKLNPKENKRADLKRTWDDFLNGSQESSGPKTRLFIGFKYVIRHECVSFSPVMFREYLAMTPGDRHQPPFDPARVNRWGEKILSQIKDQSFLF